MSPIPLPNQTEDTAAQQNFDEIAAYLSGTAQAIADAKTAADAQAALIAGLLTKLNETQPAAQATRSPNQSITSGTPTLVAWNTESFDTDTIHDNVTNNSRLTCKTAGLYYAFANLHLGGANTWIVDILLNGTVVNSAPIDTTLISRGSLGQMAVLAVNDYMEVQVTQGSGGALDVIATGSSFAMARLSHG